MRLCTGISVGSIGPRPAACARGAISASANWPHDSADSLLDHVVDRDEARLTRLRSVFSIALPTRSSAKPRSVRE